MVKSSANYALVLILPPCLFGCATVDPTLNGLIKIETAKSQPDASANVSKQQSSAIRGKSNERGCNIIPSIRVPTDVDTLYARAMRNFNFKSPEQIAIYRKTVDRTYLVDQGYKHEKQAGAFYHLAQTVSYEFPSGDRSAMWLELVISKNGTASDISAEYCVDPDDPRSSSSLTQQKIQARIKSALVG